MRVAGPLVMRPGERPRPGRLEYRSDEFSFETVPVSQARVGTLLLNDLQLSYGQDGVVLEVWGYCPHTGWLERGLELPNAREGRIGVPADLWAREASRTPGTAFRLDAEPWPVHVDGASGTVCLGWPEVKGTGLAFAPGCVMVCDERGFASSLWLRPVSGLPRARRA